MEEFEVLSDWYEPDELFHCWGRCEHCPMIMGCKHKFEEGYWKHETER